MVAVAPYGKKFGNCVKREQNSNTTSVCGNIGILLKCCNGVSQLRTMPNLKLIILRAAADLFTLIKVIIWPGKVSGSEISHEKIKTQQLWLNKMKDVHHRVIDFVRTLVKYGSIFIICFEFKTFLCVLVEREIFGGAIHKPVSKAIQQNIYIFKNILCTFSQIKIKLSSFFLCISV